MNRIPTKVRRPAVPVLVGLCLVSGLVGPSAAGPKGGRFMTNLSLLDRLTQDAVAEILDSLDVQPGQKLMILADRYHEGNDFVASAFARELTARGCKAQILGEAVPETTKAASHPNLPPATQKDNGEEDDSESGPVDPDDLYTDQDPYAPDSSQAVADSIRLALGDLPDDEEESPPGTEETEEEAPTTTPVQTTPVSRIYPKGDVLEFRVLEFGISYPSAKRRLGVLGAAGVERLGGVYLQASRIRGPSGEILAVAHGQSHTRDRLGRGDRALAEGASYPFTAPDLPSSRLSKLVEPTLLVGIIASLVYLFYQNQN